LCPRDSALVELRSEEISVPYSEPKDHRLSVVAEQGVVLPRDVHGEAVAEQPVGVVKTASGHVAFLAEQADGNPNISSRRDRVDRDFPKEQKNGSRTNRLGDPSTPQLSAILAAIPPNVYHVIAYRTWRDSPQLPKSQANSGIS
jgi:hypothetical protein